jgi:hypothetical protein
MAVYVDGLRNYDGKEAFFRGKRSCHMYADAELQLHDMAERIGMRRSWFQNDFRLPHYDLVEKRRALAIRFGAIEHTREQMAEFIKRTAPPPITYEERIYTKDIVEFLRGSENRMLSLAAIADKFSVSDRCALNALKRLERVNRVVKVGAHHWQLVGD